MVLARSIVPLTPRLAFQAIVDNVHLNVSTEQTVTILDKFVYRPTIDRLQSAGYGPATVESIQPALLVARQLDPLRGVTVFRTVFPSFLAMPPGWAAQGWRAYSGVLATIPVVMVDGPLDGMECTVNTDSNIVELPMPEGHDQVDEELYHLFAPRRPATFHLEREEAPAPPAPAALPSATYYRHGYDLEARRWAYSTQQWPSTKETSTDA